MPLAKTTRPELASLILRPRLLRRLDQGRARPVTWVWGPPGAGKTSLVASYLAARKLRAALPIAYLHRGRHRPATPIEFLRMLRLSLCPPRPLDTS